ncbi:MAG TPA: ATP-binding protein [Candidatus Binatia bacterium]
MSKARDLTETEQLREQLREAQETLNAIRNGEVDALVVQGPQAEQVYTLRGADYSARMLLQEMSEGAVTLIPDGTIVYTNKKFAELLRTPHKKVIGVSAREFVAPADRPTYDALIRRARTDLAKTELLFCAGDGTSVPTYCSVNPVLLGDELCLCMVITDLTEQKRNEEIIAAASLASSILEQAAEIIVVCDPAGTIIQASREADEFWRKSVLGQSLGQVFSLAAVNDPELKDTADLLKGCLTGKPIRGVEVNLGEPNGGNVHMLMSAGPLYDKFGSAVGCVVTFNDITKLKDAEQALRESERKSREQAQILEQQLIASGRLVSLGEITASMAHEFNNPLGIIMGFVEEMLSTTAPDGAEFETLKIIDEEAKRCQKIIQGLMEFARPTPATPQSTDVATLIDKTLKLIDARLYKQKVSLTETVAPDLPPIHADPQQLEQVLVNLYLNALDAMIGGGQLTVGAQLDGGGDSVSDVVISVADTGHGIARDELQKIFQPFFTARKKAGMGLGLSICERIINNHGGKIEVETEQGQGTLFRVRLPVKSLRQ